MQIIWTLFCNINVITYDNLIHFAKLKLYEFTQISLLFKFIHLLNNC